MPIDESTLKHYYTEAMTVPYYNVGTKVDLETEIGKWQQMDSWDSLLPTHFLRPMTRLMAEAKPMPPAYVAAKIVENGPLEEKWGSIWSAHLRSARRLGIKSSGDELTGISYGYTKDVLEQTDNTDQHITGLRLNFSTVVGPKPRFLCSVCQKERRYHKIYESKLARQITMDIKNNTTTPSQVMLGTLVAVDQHGGVKYIIAGESSFKKDKMTQPKAWGSGFSQTWNAKIKPSLTETCPKNNCFWANNDFNFDGNETLLDWDDRVITNASTKDTRELTCAGPKLVQCFLRHVPRADRNSYRIFMSEVWGAKVPATIEDFIENGKAEDKFAIDAVNIRWSTKVTKMIEGNQVAKKEIVSNPWAFYNAGDPATSCTRCRYVIPRMLCYKEPGNSNPSGNVNLKME